MGAEITYEPLPALASETPSAPSGAMAAKGKQVYSALFGPLSRAFAPVALLVSAIMPPAGIGFSLCIFQRVTGLPCPGCGLTRSVACLTHLQPKAAFSYHPFGFVLYAVLVVLAVSNVIGPPGRRRIQTWFEAHGRGAHRIYWALVIAFLVFGVARTAVAWGYPQGETAAPGVHS